jgi:hypothetical protein
MNMPWITTLLACLLFFFASVTSGNAQWTPSGPLASVPVIPDCSKTGGDIAVAVIIPAGAFIYFCPANAAMVNAAVPDAGHFYYVHEFGHIALGTSVEPAADCWAAQQLKSVPNGIHYVQQWLTYWSAFGADHPKYGTKFQRFTNVKSCAGL